MSEPPAAGGSLAHLAAKLADLTARVEAQDNILLAISLTVPLDRRVDLLKTFTALALNALARREIVAAQETQHFSDRWRALCGPDLELPQEHALLALHSGTLLHGRTSADQQQALTTWLATATEAEIADDVHEMLKPLLDAAAAAKPKRKRKPPRS